MAEKEIIIIKEIELEIVTTTSAEIVNVQTESQESGIIVIKDSSTDSNIIINKEDPELIVVSEGVKGDKGDKGDSGSETWINYAVGFSTIPTLTSTIATGDVYTYTYTSDPTLYRLVPSGTELDAFYDTFSGGVLSGLVATKRR